MATNPSAVQSGQVTSEGDTLYYEVRGNGIPLLMIAGGGGDSRWFTRIGDMVGSGCTGSFASRPKPTG